MKNFQGEPIVDEEFLRREIQSMMRLWNSRSMAHHFIGIMHSYRSRKKKKKNFTAPSTGYLRMIQV